MDDATHGLTNQLRECQNKRNNLTGKNESLRAQIKRLRTQIIDMEHRTKPSIDSAYENGYKAGQQDTQRGWQG